MKFRPLEERLWIQNKTESFSLGQNARKRSINLAEKENEQHERNETSNGVFASPFPRRRVVPRTVCLVNVRDLWYQRIVRVRVCEHRADGEKNYGRVSHLHRVGPGDEWGGGRTFRDGESWTPLISQDI